MGTEEGMDFGVSEHNNIQFGDLDDQFRREEHVGDLLGISQQQINFAQPASFNPQVRMHRQLWFQSATFHCVTKHYTYLF